MQTSRALQPASLNARAAFTRRERAETKLPRSVWIALTGIALQFLVSSNLLYLMGIHYDVPGGNPLIKFHPSSYLFVWAAISALQEQGGIGVGLRLIAAKRPAYIVFLVSMLICAVFAGVSTGTRGAAVFLEDYVTAGLLALTLELAPDHARRPLGRMLLGFCLGNVLVAIGENLTHMHVVPPFLGAIAYIEAPGDFRGTAGFDHPLTGAAVVMMTLIFLPTQRLSAVRGMLASLLLFVGLLVFGGRTALAIAIAVFTIAGVVALVKGLVGRRLAPALLARVALVVLLVPPLTYVLLTQTPVGERIVAHLYVDDSADTRSEQWSVLQQVSLREALFGMPEDQVPILIFRLGLDVKFNDIENPWLLTYLKLGVVGSAIFLVGLLPFLIRHWRIAGPWGRTLIFCALLVVSSSNSLGHKSNLMVFLVAYLAAARGESEVISSVARTRLRPASHFFQQGRWPATAVPRTGAFT